MQKHGIRKRFVEALQAKFASFGLKYSIGGQISFDVFPRACTLLRDTDPQTDSASRLG